MDSPLSTNTALRCIIIASSVTLVMPNHTYLLQPMLSQPFFSELKQRISIMFQNKLSDTHIRVINSIISILIFVRNPSLEDDSDETHNLKLIDSPCHDSRTTNLDIFHFNGHVYEKVGLSVYPDNLERIAASYRGRNNIRFWRYTLRSNTRNMRNTQVIHDANHFKWLVDGPDTISHIKIVKFSFSTNIFFREMSENNVPMEVEEAGIDEYMRDFQGMLDRMDNPSEVQGKGVGDCAGGDLVVRESGVMGREGGAEGGEAEPLPVSKDLILSCPVQRSDDSDSEGVNAISPRDERGCVTEEVVENLSVADDFVPRYVAGPYLRISEYLNKNIVNTVKRAWQVPPRVAKPPTPLAAPRSGLVQTQGGGNAVVKLAPKVNLSAPNFFGDRRSGYAINLANFSCNSSYTCTFDIARNCRICPNEHEAFPSNLVGTLVVGDSYTPCIIGGGGKCVPVFRQHNAGFREITSSLKFLLRYRKSTSTGMPCSRPNLIIVSLPSHLQAVGPDQYLKEFNIFKGWIQHFLQTGRDYDPADVRISTPCSTSVQVFEGFAPFMMGDRGLSESYAVLERTFTILSAVEPSENPGFFLNCFKKTMEKFCPEPTKASLIRYIALDPIRPEFEVYENMGAYTGLPDALFVSRNVDPEVGVFFSQELVSMIRDWHSKGEKGGFVNTIPLPAELESAIPTGPDGQLTSPEDDFNCGNNSLSSKNQRVVVVGNSNLKMISEELGKTIKDTVVFVKYPFNIFANSSEISEFVDNLKLTKADVLVLGGQGNSLLQGMATPKFKKHSPSGLPAGFSTFGAGRQRVFHAHNVASYDPEYFDNFGVFIDKIMGFVNQTGAKTVFIPPFPRYPTACCTQSGHFCAGYDGNLFNAEVVRLGTFISRMYSLKDAFVLTPEDFCHRDDWVSRGKMLKDDRVHLSDKGVQVVRGLIQRCYHFWTVMDRPKPTLGPSIPCGTRFSQWVEAHREVCGFEDLKPSGAAKRSQPPMSYQRQSKR